MPNQDPSELTESGRSDDPFQRLGLPVTFDLSTQQIRRAYLARVGTAHPDAAGESIDAAQLNAARATLADPERRANALLMHLGGPDARSEPALPDGFLMEIMELRMDIESALAADGPAGDDARTDAQADAEARRKALIETVAGQFSGLADPPNPADLAAIRVTLNAWRYIERLIEQLDPDYNPARADFAG